jgi:hypothetical protein
MDEEHTTVVVQRLLDKLGGDAPAESAVRDLLMIPLRLRSRGLCQPSSLPHLHQAFRLDTASDRRPVVPRQTKVGHTEVSSCLSVRREAFGAEV